jgi:CRP/FNR family transcriptional regulator, cyclic AMP receptor protein
MPTNAGVLAKVALFSLLDPTERATLAERIDVVAVPAGKTIFERGDPGDAMYVVTSGRVEVSFKNDTGERIVLEIAHEGDFFGEISLLDGGARTASALATEDVEALVVDRDDLHELFRIHPQSVFDLLGATGRRLRETNELLRRTASRNINEEVEDTRTKVMKAADWISAFSGSMPFLFIHCVIFFVWIMLNSGPLVKSAGNLGGFDPFPYGLLTMVVSLEAIILSVFVLLSQNRQAARDKVRNDIEYDVNLKAELEIAHMHEKVDRMQEQILAKLAVMERSKAG